MFKLSCFASLLLIVFVQGYKYKLMPVNDNIFNECPGFPGRGLDSFLDMTEFTLKLVGNLIVCGGNVTFIWKDIEETDVLAARAITEQFRYGKWGPTTFNVNIPNVCRDMYTENTPWFDVFAKYIKKEERLCINKKGLVWHFANYTLDGYEITIPGYDVTGSYRVLIHLFPRDKIGKPKNNVIYCAAMEFESLRIG